MFQHEGYGCLCAKDTVNTSPDEAPTVTLKVCPDTSTQLLFSYAPKDGLNMTGVAGGILSLLKNMASYIRCQQTNTQRLKQVILLTSSTE